MRLGKVWLPYCSCFLLAACGAQTIVPSDRHIQGKDAAPGYGVGIPQAIRRTIPLPPPAAAPKAETYSVVVTNVPVQEVLL